MGFKWVAKDNALWSLHKKFSLTEDCSCNDKSRIKVYEMQSYDNCLSTVIVCKKLN